MAERFAAVLIGSRARGTHRPDSDWDIAFITRRGTRIGAVPSGLPIENLDLDMQLLGLPASEAARRMGQIRDIGHSIVRDGITLSGEWHRPEGKKPYLEPETYRRYLGKTLNRVGKAIPPAVTASELDCR